ncbi:MAG: HPr family phosphocarrier protein [bacterium]
MNPGPRSEARLEVKNKYGLHARAARLVVLLLKKFTAEVTITRDDQTVNGRSILGLMMLAAAPGTVLEVVVEGPDAEAALAALTDIFEARFHEDA